MDDIIFDEVLNKLRTQDISGGTGGGTSYEAGPGIDSAALEDGTIAVSGLTATVSGTTATIVPKGSTVGVKLTGVGGVDVKGNTNSEIELDITDLSEGTQSITKDLLNARAVYDSVPTSYKTLTLVHVSDFHSDWSSLNRIKGKIESLGNKVNGVICTGDMVNLADDTESGIPGFSANWPSNYMTCIGNHDVYTDAVAPGNNQVTMAQRDQYYIAPFESNWGITHTSGTSYYYKDYSTQKVRLIVLDVMLYLSNETTAEAAAQTSWFTDLLTNATTGAIAKGYHVLVACHTPAANSVSRTCSFTSVYAENYYPSNNYPLSSAIVSAVSSAITNGLHFVGYLVGHWHMDIVWDVTGDGTQFAYAVTCAGLEYPPSTGSGQWIWARSLQYRDSDMDAYNLVTIDTAHDYIKIIRGGGANIDLLMRKRQAIGVNYTSGYIVDQDIARAMSNDATGDGLTVQRGIVQLAEYIDVSDLGTASTSTLSPGKAYQLNVTGGTHAITVPTVPNAKLGRTTNLKLFVGQTSLVQVNSPLILVDALTPNAVNDCRIEYRDGRAEMFVDDFQYGYIVTLTGGTQGTSDSGSLWYAGQHVDTSYITFSHAIDGQTIVMDTGGGGFFRNVNLLGNGTDKTIIKYDNYLLSMSGGGTVSSIKFKDGTRNTAIFYLDGTSKSYLFTDCVFENNISTDVSVISNNTGTIVTFERCVFKDNDSTQSSINAGGSGTGKVTMTDCFFANKKKVRVVGYSNLYISGNTFSSANDSIEVGTSAKLYISGTNVFNAPVTGASGSIIISAGATIDLSGNTTSTAMSASSIAVSAGSASVIPYGGGLAVSITGSGTSLSNAGVLS